MSSEMSAKDKKAEAEKYKLRECPFCDETYDLGFEKLDEGFVVVRCGFCGAEANIDNKNKRGAASTWNSRGGGTQRLARYLYETYRHAASRQQLSGDELPTWDELIEDNDYWTEWNAWENVAAAVQGAKYQLVFEEPDARWKKWIAKEEKEEAEGEQRR